MSYSPYCVCVAVDSARPAVRGTQNSIEACIRDKDKRGRGTTLSSIIIAPRIRSFSSSPPSADLAFGVPARTWHDPIDLRCQSRCLFFQPGEAGFALGSVERSSAYHAIHAGQARGSGCRLCPGGAASCDCRRQPRAASGSRVKVNRARVLYPRGGRTRPKLPER